MEKQASKPIRTSERIGITCPMSIRDLRQTILDKPSSQPITDRFERDAKVGAYSGRAWYSSQKEHWLGWLFHYEGPGFYGRQSWDRTAEFVYNHINCAPMLLWMAEASGVNMRLVRKASRSIVPGTSGPTQCAAIRRVVLWELVEAALRGH